MKLVDYLSKREKQIGITNQQFLNQLSGLQKRPDTNLTRLLKNRRQQLKASFSNLASKSSLSSSLFTKVESGKITPNAKILGPVSSAYQLPKDKLIAEIREDFIDDVAAILSLTRQEFVENYGAEITDRINFAYRLPQASTKKQTKTKGSGRGLQIAGWIVVVILIIVLIVGFIYINY